MVFPTFADTQWVTRILERPWIKFTMYSISLVSVGLRPPDPPYQNFCFFNNFNWLLIFVVIIYGKSSLHNYTKLEKMHYLIMYFVNLVRIKFLVESFNTFGRPQPVTGAGKFETLKIPPPFKNGKNRLKGVFLAIPTDSTVRLWLIMKHKSFNTKKCNFVKHSGDTPRPVKSLVTWYVLRVHFSSLRKRSFLWKEI